MEAMTRCQFAVRRERQSRLVAYVLELRLHETRLCSLCCNEHPGLL